MTSNEWNDRRSRRVFLCLQFFSIQLGHFFQFNSAIFKQMSAKFYTFAYSARTVWSSIMKF